MQSRLIKVRAYMHVGFTQKCRTGASVLPVGADGAVHYWTGPKNATSEKIGHGTVHPAQNEMNPVNDHRQNSFDIGGCPLAAATRPAYAAAPQGSAQRTDPALERPRSRTSMATIAPAAALEAPVTEGSDERPSSKAGPTTCTSTTTPAASTSAPPSLRRRTPRLAKTKPNPIYSPPSTSSPRSNLDSPSSASARSTLAPFSASSKRTRRTSGGGGSGGGGGGGGARGKGRGGGSRLKFKVSHGAGFASGLGRGLFRRILFAQHRFGSAGAARRCTPTLPHTTSTTALPGHAHHSHIPAPHYTRLG